jgi:hypothetical protein
MDHVGASRSRNEQRDNKAKHSFPPVIHSL